MKTIVGVVYCGFTKDYVFDKFNEMLHYCVRPVPGVDVAWIIDPWRTPIVPQGDQFKTITYGGNAWAEDILIEGREALRIMAIEGGYQKLVWQGVDCFYENAVDFSRLIHYQYPIVGALTSARNNPFKAVARRFVGLTENQIDIPERELLSRQIIDAGMPGADALVFDRQTLNISWVGKHIPWYDRVQQGMTNICEAEWMMLEQKKNNVPIKLDTSIKTWHVHESGVNGVIGPTANMFKGISVPMDSLSWE